jgi:hypothetical protein
MTQNQHLLSLRETSPRDGVCNPPPPTQEPFHGQDNQNKCKYKQLQKDPGMRFVLSPITSLGHFYLLVGER